MREPEDVFGMLSQKEPPCLETVCSSEVTRERIGRLPSPGLPTRGHGAEMPGAVAGYSSCRPCGGLPIPVGHTHGLSPHRCAVDQASSHSFAPSLVCRESALVALTED